MNETSNLDFIGRVAIVTGFGSGMGRRHALMLASRGARLVVNDISKEGAEETVKQITEAGGTAVVDTNDIVTNAKDLVKTAINNFNQLDIVVNNAGIAGFGRFWEMDGDQWWKIFDTHVKGTVEVSRHAMPYLIKSGSGRLINISSSAMLGAPNASAYSAAKTAMWGFGDAIYAEGREVGVQVTTIQPSAWTPMTEEAYDNEVILKDLRDKLPPTAVSAFITWLAHQDTTIYGECLQVSGTSAGRTVFSAMPRIIIDEATSEEWSNNEDNLMKDGELTPLRDVNESFRAELVFLEPSAESEIPMEASDVSKK